MFETIATAFDWLDRTETHKGSLVHDLLRIRR